LFKDQHKFLSSGVHISLIHQYLTLYWGKRGQERSGVKSAA